MFTCEICQKIFTRKHNYQSHINRKLKCTKSIDNLARNANCETPTGFLNIINDLLNRISILEEDVCYLNYKNKFLEKKLLNPDKYHIFNYRETVNIRERLEII